MSNKLSIKDLDLKDKKALIRVDFNVPFQEGRITDDTRIRAALPTIQYALDQGAAVILMSHLGRPNGQSHAEDSLAPCAKRLSELLHRPVQMAPDCEGPQVKKMAKELQPGQILLLENLRFHPGEEKPQTEPTFVSGLAELGDVYIDDAFGCAHRLHASITSLPSFFPEQAAAGFLMEKEIAYLSTTLTHPQRPFCAVLGGSKISTKFKMIQALMQKADVLLIGGAMAYTFFKADGIPMGNSKVEEDFLGVARQLQSVTIQSRCRLLLPLDLVVTTKIDPSAERRVISIQDGIPEGFEGVDIGPKTIERYRQEIQQSQTVFWNGPMGVFECPPCDTGTNAIAQALAEMQGKATTIVGGGDSIAAIEHAGVTDRISHISTGGGATLEYIEFGQLVGIDALSNAKQATSSKL